MSARVPELLEYPVDYPVKVIGPAADDLVEHVRALVTGTGAVLVGDPPTTRPSAGGKYLSVTLTARLTSEEQRRAVHAALHADPRVLYSL